MNKLEGTKYFTKLNVRWGYNNIQTRKGDKQKAAFKTNKGLFKPTVMFFGMCNSLATFQSMMDNIFITMIKGKLVIVYMDNILIFAGCYDFKPSSDNCLYSCLVLGRLSTVYSRCTWFQFNLSAQRVPLDVVLSQGFESEVGS